MDLTFDAGVDDQGVVLCMHPYCTSPAVVIHAPGECGYAACGLDAWGETCPSCDAPWFESPEAA